MSLISETKLVVTKGCLDFLVEEVERNRRKIELLEAQTRVMNGFFMLAEKMAGAKSLGFEHDLLYQAKSEIRRAVEIATEKESEKGVEK